MDRAVPERFGFLDLPVARRLLAGDEPGWPTELSDEDFARQLGHLCRIQRVCERHVADPAFRAAFTRDPDGTLAAEGVEVKAEELLPLWGQGPPGAPLSPTVERFVDFRERRARARRLLAVAGEIRDPRMKAWWQRQRARTRTQFEPLAARHILHAPIVFELSKGCTVGCWFCSVEAAPFASSWAFTGDHAAEWKRVLAEVGDLLGASAQAGFCYCATDPFDNPDYERFLVAYHEAIGIFPQTTTALALRDPERTRALLRLAGEKGCGLNRFSVLSLGQLERIHRDYRPEDLAFVGLVLQNREASLIKANAGRARRRKRAREPLADGSACCISGFVVNLVDRTAELISPCPADDRWPQGQITFAEGRFADAAELRALLERMIAEHMPTGVEGTRRIAFRRDLTYHPVGDGFHLATRFTTLKFTGDVAIRRLGDLLHEGRRTPEELSAGMAMCGLPAAAAERSLQMFHDRGVLDEEPAPPHRPSLPIAR